MLFKAVKISMPAESITTILRRIVIFLTFSFLLTVANQHAFFMIDDLFNKIIILQSKANYIKTLYLK